MLLPKTYQAKITKNLTLTPRVHQIILELAEPKTIEFTAGQFLMFQVSDTIKRAYSIATKPSDNTKIELLIDIVPGGPASQYFSKVKEDTSCTFMAPYGQFILRDTPHDKIFIAGSTGVAPMRSMILDYLTGPAGRFVDSRFAAASKNDSSQTDQLQRPSPVSLSLYFGVNKTEEVFLLEEFSSLEFENTNFHFIPVVQNPEHGDWAGEKGLVTDPLFRNTSDLKNKDYYLCGSPAMVPAVKQQLLDKGVSQKNIFNERF